MSDALTATVSGTLKQNEYRCAHCGTVYEFTDFDAKTELETNFPCCSVEDCAIVCDDCFNGMPVKKWSDNWNSLSKEEQEKLNV